MIDAALVAGKLAGSSRAACRSSFLGRPGGLCCGSAHAVRPTMRRLRTSVPSSPQFCRLTSTPLGPYRAQAGIEQPGGEQRCVQDRVRHCGAARDDGGDGSDQPRAGYVCGN